MSTIVKAFQDCFILSDPILDEKLILLLLVVLL